MGPLQDRDPFHIYRDEDSRLSIGIKGMACGKVLWGGNRGTLIRQCN